ncbi:hypothetical protein [Agrobacterium sp.]|uniref:hypothetical protein n=1 Tax=Agrobacterium sp. TaxID=361 RepID=UPI0028A6DE90
MENERKFDEGQKLLSDPTLPTISQINDELLSLTLDQIKNDCAFRSVTKAQRWAVALKIEKIKLEGGKFACGHKKIRSFLRLHFTHSEAQPYLEATITGLNAAFHIILIESGANVQPVEDLPFSVYIGRARHGKRQLATTKNRAGGKPVPASISDEVAFIGLNPNDGLPSAAKAVDIWLKLSGSLRAATGDTANRLWVWRRVPGTRKILTHGPMVNHDPWYKFLRKIADNPLLGGVPITRKAIRKAVSNSHASSGDFDFVIQQALLGHVKSATTFSYLSEGAVRAFLVSQVREFTNAWEASSVINVEDAARKLGVTESELIRRQRLGLENGLAFAALGNDDPLGREVDDAPQLHETAKLFVISEKSLFSLEVARRALWAQFDLIVNANPHRFLRTWIPWMAIVEGYYSRLETSRFRVRLKRVRQDVSARLDSGHLSLPVLW